MEPEEKKMIILFGLITIVSLVVGLFGIIFRKKIKSESHYYISLNMLLNGVLLLPVGLFGFYYFWNLATGMRIFRENTFYLIVFAYLGIMSLIVGIHGLINKEKINDQAYNRFLEAAIIAFFMTFIGIAVWVWVWGWPWDPHILFEWQKSSPYYNEIFSQ